MTENQLNCFAAVCETMSFSKAANRLYISQPAVSKSISKLEEELGSELFAQVGSRLTLTPAGEVFYEYVQLLRHEREELQEKLEKLRSGEGRTLRLGCPETWDPSFFTARLERSFAEAAPGCQLIIEAHRLSELLLRLQNGTLDLVISHEFYTPSIPGLAVKELTGTGTGILYAPSAFPEPVGFEDLARAGFLLYDRDIEKRFGAVIRETCLRRGCTAKVTALGQLSKALFELSRGNGVMLFTDWDSIIAGKNYGYYRLPDVLPIRFLYLSERLKPFALRFMEVSRAAFSDGGRG